MESRSFFIGIRQFPVCARCTGILACVFLAVPLGLLAATYNVPLALPVLLILPLLIDGFTQLLSTYESTNTRRFFTGTAFGSGLILALAKAIQWIF